MRTVAKPRPEPKLVEHILGQAYVTVDEAALVLRCSYWSVTQMVRRGLLPTRRLSGRLMFTPEELLRCGETKPLPSHSVAPTTGRPRSAVA